MSFCSHEILKHFLLDCQELETVRKPILKDFINVWDDVAFDYPLVADLSLVQLLADPSFCSRLVILVIKKVKIFSGTASFS